MLAAYNFYSVSLSFLSELCKRISPQCSGPDPRIAQLLAQPAPACDASAHAGSAVRRRAHRSGSLLPAPGNKRMACGYSCGPPRCRLPTADSSQLALRRAARAGAQPRAEAGAPPAGGAGVWFEIRTVCAASDQASRLTNCAPTSACVDLFLAGESADQSRTL